jgi:hypothetical protein
VLTSSFNYKLQVFLLVLLLLVALVLVAVVLQMVKKVKEFRRESAMGDYGKLDGSEHEVSFSSEMSSFG